MPDGNAEKGRKAETPAKTDKPPKAGGARKRSANQAPPEGNAGRKSGRKSGRKRRAETPGGNADREQRAEIPGGNNENEKNIF
ncbi:MAG: hypothetical protein EGP74_11330 [Alistipes finegoldii]|nr:hypothetical protein [Alistipes finegoldii]